MKLPPILSIFIACLFSAHAFAAQPKIEIVEQFDNLRVIAFLDEGDVAATPEWNPNLAAIPLTVGQAIQAVKDFTGSADALGAIREIEIRRIPGQALRWHYLIRIANPQLRTKYEIYVVLMNGKVVTGMIEPDGLR